MRFFSEVSRNWLAPIMEHTVHDGAAFARVSRSRERPADDQQALNWSVHDGSAFAAAIRAGSGRAINDRLLLNGAWRNRWREDWKCSQPRGERVRFRHSALDAPKRPPTIDELSGDLSSPLPSPTIEELSASSVTRLANYSLHEIIGIGQFAVVHRATNKETLRLVALKLTARPVKVERHGAPAEEMDVSCFRHEVAVISKTPLYLGHGLAEVGAGEGLMDCELGPAECDCVVIGRGGGVARLRRDGVHRG